MPAIRPSVGAPIPAPKGPLAPAAPAATPDAEPADALFAADLLEAAAPGAIDAEKVTDYGQILVGDKPIARLAPAPSEPAAPGQLAQDILLRGLVNASAIFMKASKKATPEDVPPWRRPESALAALAVPLPESCRSKKPFGKLTVMRPGLGNIPPSAAMVFRTAQLTGKVVVAHTNVTHPKQQELRECTTYQGIPVPKELKGKVFEIGSPEPCFISYLQSSDNLLVQLQKMHEAKDVLGVDVLTDRITLFGHSQGGLDGALTRSRLEDAGYDKAIGKLVCVASPFGGAPAADRVLGLLAGTGAAITDMTDGFRAIKQLDPQWTKPWFDNDRMKKLVDLAYAGAIGGTPRIVPKLLPPFFAIHDKHNVRPTMRLLATITDAADLLGLSPLQKLQRIFKPVADDGMVPVPSALYGQECRRLEHPYDHMGIWEDFEVVDQLASELVELKQKAAKPAAA